MPIASIVMLLFFFSIPSLKFPSVFTFLSVSTFLSSSKGLFFISLTSTSESTISLFFSSSISPFIDVLSPIIIFSILSRPSFDVMLTFFAFLSLSFFVLSSLLPIFFFSLIAASFLWISLMYVVLNAFFQQLSRFFLHFLYWLLAIFSLLCNQILFNAKAYSPSHYLLIEYTL